MLKGKYVLLDFKAVPDKKQAVWQVVEENGNLLTLLTSKGTQAGARPQRVERSRVIAYSPSEAEMEALAVEISKDGNSTYKKQQRLKAAFLDRVYSMCAKASR